MNKNGMGVGSALIVLVFAVLCLTIFALITYTGAQNDMALAQAEKQLITSYYTADTRAEYILYGLSVDGVVDVEVARDWDSDIGAEVASFVCPISEQMELFVEAALYGDFDYDILSWRMRATDSWAANDSISVWPGVETGDDMNLLQDGGTSPWAGK